MIQATLLLSAAAISSGYNVSPKRAPTCAKYSGMVQTSKEDMLFVANEAKSDFNNIIKTIWENAEFPEFELSNLYGNMLRGIFHDCAEFDVNSSDKLGCDGCLSDDEGNNGLSSEGSIILTVIEELWQKYCDKISRADFWALMGKFTVEASDETKSMNIKFSYGRPDSKSCDTKGRLPGHQVGISEFHRVFENQMQLTLYDAVVLSGGHTLGHVHTDVSGFGFFRSKRELQKEESTNAWVRDPHVFNSDYYSSMIEIPWINIQRGRDTSINFWKAGKGKGKETIMLNADMVLGFFANTDKDLKRDPSGAHIGIIGEECSEDAVDGEYGCFEEKRNNPGKGGWPDTYEQCRAYIENNGAFLRDFQDSYYKMINTGFSVDGEQQDGRSAKVGNLKNIQIPYYFGALADPGDFVREESAEDSAEDSSEDSIEAAASVNVDTGSGADSSNQNSVIAVGVACGSAGFVLAGMAAFFMRKSSMNGKNEISELP